MTRVLLVVLGITLLGAILQRPYEVQSRDRLLEPPSMAHPLGTDRLGRDVLARFAAGAKTSLLLAGAAAVLSLGVALVAGTVAGYLGGAVDFLFCRFSDIVLSLPWIFALLIARALLPLDAPAWMGFSAIALLLTVAGWAGPATVVRSAVRALRGGDYILHAMAQGRSQLRILTVDVWAHVRPLLAVQFAHLVPAFVMAEVSLGFLGLGPAEPFPSWGAMLRDLESTHAIARNPYLLAPAAGLLATVAVLQSGSRALASRSRA